MPDLFIIYLFFCASTLFNNQTKQNSSLDSTTHNASLLGCSVCSGMCSVTFVTMAMTPRCDVSRQCDVSVCSRRGAVPRREKRTDAIFKHIQGSCRHRKARWCSLVIGVLPLVHLFPTVGQSEALKSVWRVRSKGQRSGGKTRGSEVRGPKTSALMLTSYKKGLALT